MSTPLDFHFNFHTLDWLYMDRDYVNRKSLQAMNVFLVSQMTSSEESEESRGEKEKKIE